MQVRHRAHHASLPRLLLAFFPVLARHSYGLFPRQRSSLPGPDLLFALPLPVLHEMLSQLVPFKVVCRYRISSISLAPYPSVAPSRQLWCMAACVLSVCPTLIDGDAASDVRKGMEANGKVTTALYGREILRYECDSLSVPDRAKRRPARDAGIAASLIPRSLE